MHVRAFLLQLHDIAKRKGAERYMECCSRRCQGLREVLEEAARAGLRYKESLPLHVRLAQEKREEWEEAACKMREEMEEKVRKRREEWEEEVRKIREIMNAGRYSIHKEREEGVRKKWEDRQLAK